MESIRRYREFYAEYVTRAAGSSNERLISAFSRVERERFLGPGPWEVYVGNGRYLTTVSDDPRLVYQDTLIGIDSSRRINNGQPTLHAACISACDPQPGEVVLHIGTGTGYYTAVLAEMVGNTSSITALGIDAVLAAKARANLADRREVSVSAVSGADAILDSADIIYVSAGATHPLNVWLDALRMGGRLLFPLTGENDYGFMLLVTRMGVDEFSARALMRAGFIPCLGARDEQASRSLAMALRRDSMNDIRSVRRNTVPDSTSWLSGSGWWLSTAESSSGPSDDSVTVDGAQRTA